MKRFAFPVVLAAILAAGVAFSSASNAARKPVSEDALVRSGHTVDHSCGAVTGAGEPMQLAASIKCEEFSDGGCVTEGAACGRVATKRAGICTTVINKHKQVSCTCVK